MVLTLAIVLRTSTHAMIATVADSSARSTNTIVATCADSVICCHCRWMKGVVLMCVAVMGALRGLPSRKSVSVHVGKCYCRTYILSSVIQLAADVTIVMLVSEERH